MSSQLSNSAPTNEKRLSYSPIFQYLKMLPVIFRRGISREINPKLAKIELSSFGIESSEIKPQLKKEKIKNFTEKKPEKNLGKNVTKPFVPTARKDLFSLNSKRQEYRRRYA